MSDVIRTSAALFESRVPQVASIDLADRASWRWSSGVVRVAPGKLTCTDNDPRVFLACPRALSQRLIGTRMDIDLDSAADGTLQVFWDLGAGFSEDCSARCRLQDRAPGRQTWSVRLPPGVIGLRLDPLDRPGQLDILSIRFYEPAPRGPDAFPFEPFVGSGPTHSWLALPETQQIAGRRVLGANQSSWPQWLFGGLIGRPVGRCLHLGAHDAAFGVHAVQTGRVTEYLAVPSIGAPVTPPISAGNVHWRPSVTSIPPGHFDLVLSTGYFSSGGAGLPAVSALLERTAGALVLVERFHIPGETGKRLLARYLQRAAASLPPGWTSGRVDPLARPACHLDHEFFERFDCFEVRPFGGTLAEPLFDRLPVDFFGLGAFTMLGAISGAHLLLEETLIATGLLGSLFNVVIAVPRGRRFDLAHTPTGWSVDADVAFDRLRTESTTPSGALDADGLADALERGLERVDSWDLPETAGTDLNRVKDFLRRGLRRWSKSI